MNRATVWVFLLSVCWLGGCQAHTAKPTEPKAGAGANKSTAPTGKSPAAKPSGASCEKNAGPSTADLEKVAAADIQRARAALSKFKTVKQAMAAGYTWVSMAGCVTSGSASRGAIGEHYANAKLAFDGLIDIEKPEVLIYEPSADGTKKLVGVYYTFAVGKWGQKDGKKAWIPPPTMPGNPSLFHVSYDGPLVTPSGIVHYGLHVWLFKKNPKGMFNPWNPAVSCAAAKKSTVLKRLKCWHPGWRPGGP